MIVQSGVRSRSYLTEEEYYKSLSKELDELSPDEMDFVLKLVDDEFNAEVRSYEFKYEPVDIETFITDPFYLGIVGKTLYPAWIDDLIELFSGDYHEAIVTGGIGTGKTTFAHIAVIRMLYEASCLRNPQQSYGIMDGTPICFANVGVNKTNAQKVVFEGIAAKLQLSQYFLTEFKPEAQKTKEIIFADNIQITPGSSTETGVIGMNIFGGILDEVNFHDNRRKSIVQNASHSRWGHYGKAEILYSAIKRRMKSRFMRQGKLPGILMLVSSKQTVTDFTEKRIRDSIDDPSVFVRDYSQWDAKGRKYFAPKSFNVLVGNDKIRSRILEEDEDLSKYENLSEDTPVHIVEVPDDFRADFESDLEGAIRDIAGIATVAINNFIQKREKIFEMINKSRRHPFSTIAYDMSIGGGFLWNLMVHEVDGEWRPLLNPFAARHAHIDLALTGDSAGLSIGHISHMVEVVRSRNDQDGKRVIYKELAPYIVFDLVLEIVPPVGDEIEIAGIRQLIYDLSDHGFPIRLITMDSFQSRDSLQQFKRKGYRAEILSVDVTADPYDSGKTALYENRVDCYEYAKLTDELKGLEKNVQTGKVDHRATGSKDVSDSWAGVVHSLTTNAKGGLPAPMKGESYTPNDTSDLNDDGRWVLNNRHASKDKDGNHVPMPLPFLKG